MVNTASATTRLESSLTGICYAVKAIRQSPDCDLYQVYVARDNVGYLRIEFVPPDRSIKPYHRLAEAPLRGAHDAVITEQITVIADRLAELITRDYSFYNKRHQVTERKYGSTSGLPSVSLTARSELPAKHSEDLRALVIYELGSEVAGLAFRET